MSDTRPELSKKSKYWIPKHRYYELKHFVMQYPDWLKKRSEINSMVRACQDPAGRINSLPDPVGQAVEKRSVYTTNISMCDQAAKETDPVIGNYILEAVINGMSYDTLKATWNVPCCRDLYYELYRRFFWLLDSARK